MAVSEDDQSQPLSGMAVLTDNYTLISYHDIEVEMKKNDEKLTIMMTRCR